MNNKIKIFLMFLILSIFVSCVTPIGMTSSSSILPDDKKIVKLGAVEGSDGSIALFGLVSIGRPDIDLAIKDALKKKGGDAIVNVRLYQRTAWYLVVSYTEIIVSGEAVKFEDNEDSKKKKGK